MGGVNVTRMIERWFPCAEVSEASQNGWGSGNSESALWVWFAKRPLVQAKAAVLTSLLPWPDDSVEQRRLQELVRRALSGYDVGRNEIIRELGRCYSTSPSVLDPFSGRAMIPLEAARLGVKALGIDYSPFATLGGILLADYPLRNWSNEPALPFGSGQLSVGLRLLDDVRAVLDEVGHRFTAAMQPYYPTHDGKQPWGYLWASTLPCQECGLRFPLIGQLQLRLPRPKRADPGQSFRLVVDRGSGTFGIRVHEGPPTGQPTRIQAGKSKYSSSGRVAVCPFCDHVHSKGVHTRLSMEGMREDALLAAADIDEDGTKVFRPPTPEEFAATEAAAKALAYEPPFDGLVAVPDERIPPGNTWTIQSVNYGDRTYGDLCVARQTLALIKVARAINQVSTEVLAAGASADYVKALAGYATAVMMRKIRRSTRGARLQVAGGAQVGDLFVNQSAVSFSYDWFESGLSDGPGSWWSLADQTVASLRGMLKRDGGRPAHISRGSAVSLPFRDGSQDAVVTDPPYDDMIDYSDSSDLFYVWAKRAMSIADPMLTFTLNPDGVQEKEEEIIVKRGGSQSNDHRTQQFYDAMIAKSFSQGRRVLSDDGVLTIVFGHGDPDVWHRLLSAITGAGLMLTGSWPAKTEQGGAAAGAANIVTTLTMSCRPARANRSPGRANLVEAEVKREVKARVPMWEATGLALPDQRMASAGPAMEVVGRYSEVLDNLGEPVAPDRYLLVARRAVDEAAAIEVDHLPLETFDLRTRFALSWARDYGRSVAPKSEARWQALAADLELYVLRGVLTEVSKGVRLSTAAEFRGRINETSSVIDVALALAKAWPEGLDAVGEVLLASQRNTDDPFLWAAMNFLSSRLPEADPDAMAWAGLVRSRRAIGNAAHEFASVMRRAEADAEAKNRQGALFDLNGASTEDQ
jgi:adenine-specific DNA methylase